MSRLTANDSKMALVRLLFWMHFAASVLVPFFRDWGGLSFSQILLLNAWFMTWCFLLEVPTGAVADRSLPALLAGLGAAVPILALATRPAARHLEASVAR